jgi:hypothetical protein
VEDSAPQGFPRDTKHPEISLDDFRKAKALDDSYRVVFGKSFKKKSLKKLRKFDPHRIKVKRIIYFCPEGNENAYVPCNKVVVGINELYYLPNKMVIRVSYINAKEKVAYGSCI